MGVDPYKTDYKLVLTFPRASAPVLTPGDFPSVFRYNQGTVLIDENPKSHSSNSQHTGSASIPYQQQHIVHKTLQEQSPATKDLKHHDRHHTRQTPSASTRQNDRLPSYLYCTTYSNPWTALTHFQYQVIIISHRYTIQYLLRNLIRIIPQIPYVQFFTLPYNSLAFRTIPQLPAHFLKSLQYSIE